MNNYLPFLDPYNAVGFGIDLLTGKPKPAPADLAPPPAAGGSSTFYKTPPQQELPPPPQDFGARGKANRVDVPGGFVVGDGFQPGDPEYQPPGTVDGTSARPIVDATTTELPAPNADGSMPPVDPNEAYAPNSKASESSLDLSAPSWGRFMSNPAASDALIAFGAGMLGGDGFNDGLAKGAMGFAGALKPYERMSQAEQDKMLYEAKLKARIAREGVGSTAGKWRKVDVIDHGDGTQSSVLFNDVTKEYSYEPLNGTRATDAATGARNRKVGQGEGEAITKFREVAGQAPEKIAMYDSALSVLDDAGVGRDWATRGARFLAEGLNTELYGIDPQKAETFRIATRNMELQAAQALKGQGQVTEFERKILQESIPNINSNREAAREVLRILRRIEERKQLKLSAFEDAYAENPNLTMSQFNREWQSILDAMPAPATSTTTGQRKPLSSILD